MKRTPTVKIPAPAGVATSSAPVLQSRHTDAVVAGEAVGHEVERSSPPISEIPNPEFVEDDDDVSDVPLVDSRENSRSPFRRCNAGTRSSLRATMERLRSALAYVSSPSGQTGISGMITSDSDGFGTDPEEATTSMMAHQSAPMSASPSTRDFGEDFDGPTTLSSTSVVMAPHSVSSSAITYSHPDPILTAPASWQSQFPSWNEASRPADDRSYSPVGIHLYFWGRCTE